MHIVLHTPPVSRVLFRLVDVLCGQVAPEVNGDNAKVISGLSKARMLSLLCVCA